MKAIDNHALKDYITQAERAWLRVFDSGKPSHLHSPDGAPLRRLPRCWQSRQRIYAYFRRWWGPRLASHMLCNLPIFVRQGCLYVAAYDVPPISLNVREVQVVRERDGVIVVSTTLVGGFDEPWRVQHVLRRNPLDKRLMIVERSDPEDFRYRVPYLDE